jgi:signal transduction histidine kinase
MNLLSNAIKFTEQGKVAIRVSFLEIRDQTAELRFEI